MMTELDLISSLGGIMGLTLGLGFLQMAELLDQGILHLSAAVGRLRLKSLEIKTRMVERRSSSEGARILLKQRRQLIFLLGVRCPELSVIRTSC